MTLKQTVNEPVGQLRHQRVFWMSIQSIFFSALKDFWEE